MSTHRENVINNATFNATVTSAAFTNDGRVAWVVVTRVGAITTTPTLTITVNASWDGVNWFLVTTAAAISTANANQRLIFAPGTSLGAIVEPFIQVVATFGGSGSFANTSVDLAGIGQYD